jgi:hypothetical protein
MEPIDPYSHQQGEGHSAEQRTELNISPVSGASIEPQDAHWLRMDPSLTRAVLAKTEEELLASLAALMRNKVEYEQASRRFAQVQMETELAKQELATIKEQIRCAEEEVAIDKPSSGRACLRNWPPSPWRSLKCTLSANKCLPSFSPRPRPRLFFDA